uniref:Uncharacterized protein n=1 Tax=Arundo donax TaxID=35708 RepID=A0A0A8YQQ2_ARUDO
MQCNNKNKAITQCYRTMIYQGHK